MTKERVIYLDIIKISAILLVIFNHSHWGINDEGVFWNFLHHFIYGFCKCAVPLFIMVTGSLMLKKERSYKEMFTKRIFRIIPPIIVVFLLDAIINDGSSKDFFLSIFFTGYSNVYWLWYLYLLLGFYLLTPFLYKMISRMNDKDYIIFILVFIIGGGIIEQIPYLTNLFLGHSVSVQNGLSSGMVSVAIGFYVAGYYLDNLKISSKVFKISTVVFLINLVINTLLLRYTVMNDLSYDSILHYDSFLVVIMSICLFIMFKYLFSKPLKHKKVESLIVNMSLCVFGIYLFHPYFLSYVANFDFMQRLLDYNSFIGIIVDDVIVFVVLLVIVYGLRKIPYVKKFL